MCLACIGVWLKVIQYRNELVHAIFKVNDEWLLGLRTSLSNFIRQFRNEPCMEKVQQKIEEVSVHVCLCAHAFMRVYLHVCNCHLVITAIWA